MKRHLLIIIASLAIILPFSAFSQAVRKGDMLPGSHKTLKRIKGNSKQPADFKVYSNPATSKLTIVYTSKITEKAHIAIYDEEGKLVSQKDISVIKGPNTWEYDLRQNVTGVLFIKFKMKDVERTVKVIKSAKSR